MEFKQNVYKERCCAVKLVIDQNLTHFIGFIAKVMFGKIVITTKNYITNLMMKGSRDAHATQER